MGKQRARDRTSRTGSKQGTGMSEPQGNGDTRAAGRAGRGRTRPHATTGAQTGGASVRLGAEGERESAV
ncbi:hypothetical protein GCM10027294_05760 [Marinactinospora endophytica]